MTKAEQLQEVMSIAADYPKATIQACYGTLFFLIGSCCDVRRAQLDSKLKELGCYEYQGGYAFDVR